MKKAVPLLSVMLVSGCAFMGNTPQASFVRNTEKGNITYVFPKSQCDDLYFDDHCGSISSDIKSTTESSRSIKLSKYCIDYGYSKKKSVSIHM